MRRPRRWTAGVALMAWAAAGTPVADAPLAAPVATCLITQVPQLAFGAYDVTSSAPDDTQSQLKYICDSSISTLRINLGPGLSGSFTTRQMASGGNRLSYNVYTDSARTKIFGDGSAATSYYSKFLPLIDSATFYGRIPAQQGGIRVGSYSDTLKITLLF